MQMFSCEFCKIFKNTFFTEHLRMTASAVSNIFKGYLRYKTILCHKVVLDV